jgi:orotate phosphoribosyltransferase
VLGRCYAAAITSSGLQYDMLFGPALQGIPLVSATAAALYSDHGEHALRSTARKPSRMVKAAALLDGPWQAGADS